jgi:tetrahydromethanopterin S-methyltransferase subunit F
MIRIDTRVLVGGLVAALVLGLVAGYLLAGVL